jgi:hypothetical protein
MTYENSRTFYDGKEILRVFFVSPPPPIKTWTGQTMGACHGVGTEKRNAQNDNEESESSEDCEGNTGYGNVIQIKPDSGSVVLLTMNLRVLLSLPLQLIN